MKELIEQIGGRERLEEIAEDCAEARFSEIEAMARALLAVLDAKPVGTVSIVQDLYATPRRNIATVNMRPDLVLSEMRDGDNLYTTPPAASVNSPVIPEGWKIVPTELTRGMQNAWDSAPNCNRDDEDENMRNAYRALIASAPSIKGWKLVPLKAFPSQWAAGQRAFDAAGINKIDPVYRAMVEAAPAPGGDTE